MAQLIIFQGPNANDGQGDAGLIPFQKVNTNFTDLYSRYKPLTVATLPAAATAGAGATYFVTDATATTFASIVAGGAANGVPVYSDGTNWRIG